MAKRMDIDKLHGTRIGVPGSPLPLSWHQHPQVLVREIESETRRGGPPMTNPADPKPRKQHG